MSCKRIKHKSSRQLQPHRDPKSEKYVPNDADNRPSQDPNRAQIESPPYRVDAEALGFDSQHSIQTLEWCLDKLRDPEFHLEYVCKACEEWKPASRTRPRRRGAKFPEESCNGCSYSLITGGRGSFATTDRDAAFSWWAATRAKITDLEYQRRETKSAHQRENLKKRIEKAHQELKGATIACKKLGFNPAVAIGDRGEAFQEPKRQAVQTDASCSNCSNWSYDEQLSKRKPRGYCWLKESGDHTSGDYWCAEYKPDTDRSHSLEKGSAEELVIYKKFGNDKKPVTVGFIESNPY